MNIGVLLYQRDNAIFAPQTVARLADITNVVGFKDGHGNLELLARIRLAASTAFCLIAGILALTGEIQQMDFWPLLAYLAATWAIFRWAGRGGWRDRLAAFSPIADVVFVFALQRQAPVMGPWADFAAGWILGLYALLVGFSALSLRLRVIATTGDPPGIRKILTHLGLPTEVPGPRAPPHDLFGWS